MPNLNNVRNKAIVFKDVAQVTHTGWTIAGMVASQCGVPLFSASQGNAMSGMPHFLSGATCLGDVLSRNKYELSYLGGASLEFAGKGEFYRTHGFSSIQGRAELTEKLDDPSYQSAWGLYDDSLFEFAQQKLAVRTEQDSPFALFMLTLDTHHPIGHPSASCAQQQYADGTNAILNAVHCSDKLISEFIGYVQDNGFDNNTLIVLGSDHLSMRNTATNLLNQGDRKNMLIMIPPDLQEGIVIDTPSSILDVAATILPMLGFKSEALGFGRNILNTNKSKLIDKYEHFNSYLNSTSALVSSFWNYPEAVSNIVFDEEKKQAYFDSEVVKYPALFLIDDDNLTEKLLFEFYSEIKLSEYLQAEELGRKILWVDQCNKIGLVFESFQTLGESKNCVAIGHLGSQEIFVQQVGNKIKIKKDKILEALNKKDKKINHENHQKQVSVLKSLTHSTTQFNEYKVLPESSGYDSIFIKSASGDNDGDSFIKYSHDSKEQILKGLSRGLNLIGFSNQKKTEIIYKADTCSVGKDVGKDKKIVELINNHDYDFYLVVAHDSTLCEDAERLRNHMEGSSLKSWSELVLHQAYTAIIYKDGTSLELLGKSKQSINVVLK